MTNEDATKPSQQTAALATTSAAPVQRLLSGAALEKILVKGDLGALTPRERVQYCLDRCASLGLDPASQPFGLYDLQGKKVLYAQKSCTDQLSARFGLSKKLGTPMIDREGGVITVACTVSDREGRSVDDFGVVSLDGKGGDKTGDDLANAIMKAATKAGRRAILAYAGLGGVSDESELATIKGAKIVPFTYAAPAEGEAVEAEVVAEAETPAHWVARVKAAKNETELTAVWREFRQASAMMAEPDVKTVKRAYGDRQEELDGLTHGRPCRYPRPVRHGHDGLAYRTVRHEGQGGE